LTLAREADARYPEAEALIGLAAAYADVDQLDQARRYAEQALGLTRTAGYRLLEGCALTTLADINYRLGQTDRAVEHAEQALAIHRDTGHRPGADHTLHILSHALRDTYPAAACR